MAGASFNPLKVVLHHPTIGTTECDFCDLRLYWHTAAHIGSVAGSTVLGAVAAHTLAHDCTNRAGCGRASQFPLILRYYCFRNSSCMLSCHIIHYHQTKFLWVFNTLCWSASVRSSLRNMSTKYTLILWKITVWFILTAMPNIRITVSYHTSCGYFPNTCFGWLILRWLRTFKHSFEVYRYSITH